MAEYGMHVFNEDGELVVDTTRLMHRLWHVELVNSFGTMLYEEPLDHEPTVIAQGVNNFAMLWEHVRDGQGRYTGITLSNATWLGTGPTLVVVYARK